MRRFSDPVILPGTGESAAERLARSLPLAGTVGMAYVGRRAVPVEVADRAGVRFDPDFAGRPAVLMPLYDDRGRLTSVHGRYLHATRTQDKMLTLGAGGGTVNVLRGWRGEPLILVEGLFDALSLATCGWSCAATIGRWAPWLAAATAGRVVWLAFDAGRAGDADVQLYRQRLPDAAVRRLPPPPRCKDWNTALVKRGPAEVARWVSEGVAANDGRRP
jgi:Toprim-like